MRELLARYEARGGHPLGPPRRPAGVLAAQFGAVAAAPERCGALVTREVPASGVRQ
jgi:hypothetical protein